MIFRLLIFQALGQYSGLDVQPLVWIAAQGAFEAIWFLRTDLWADEIVKLPPR